MVSQVTVSPGLMRQAALINCKIMQGEMNKLVLKLRGAGDITRIQGDGVLSWTTNSAAGGDREVIVQFNQPQKDSFAILVQMQTPLGAFPQSLEALRLQPEGATRFAGAFRIVNEGAVRLEVTQASGLSQISPDQFPESSLFRATGSQRFAYLFSSAEFALKIQADQILPEVGVSEVLAYHLGENELSVDAQIELDIREAPLRELLVNIPKGYVVAQPVASGLSDYFTGTNADTRRRGTAAGLWPARFGPAGRPDPPRTQPVARRDELDAAAHRGGEGEIRARIHRGVGGQRLPPHDGPHAVVDGNRHGIFSEPACGPPDGVPVERFGLVGDVAGRAPAADGAGGRVSSFFHRRRHRLRQQRDQLRRQRRAGFGVSRRAVG